MRKQVGIGQLMRIVGIALCFDTVVRRLAVLQALHAAPVRERQQKMVDVVVMRAVERIGLTHQFVELSQQRGAAGSSPQDALKPYR